MSEQKLSLLSDYSRYTFAEDGTVTNNATGSIMTVDPNYTLPRVKLTKNDGSRKWLYTHDIIKEVAAAGTSAAAKDADAQSGLREAIIHPIRHPHEDPATQAAIRKSLRNPVIIPPLSIGFGQKRAKKQPLTDEQVADIKKRLNAGETVRKIADFFNMKGHSTISDIKSGRTYSHVEAAE